MPIYEYNCPKCGDFERMRKISDPPLTKCPTCRRKVSKLISNTSFQLKGSGWYVTDYGKSGSTGTKPSESNSDSAASTEAAAKPTKESAKDAKSKDTKAA